MLKSPISSASDYCKSSMDRACLKPTGLCPFNLRFSGLCFLLSAFCLLATSCFKKQERNCTDFKTGKYKVEVEVKGQKHSSIIDRNDSTQTETYLGKTQTASVRWVNDCEYIIQNLHPETMAEKKAYTFKILSSTKKSYTFEFGEVNKDERQTGTATKIN